MTVLDASALLAFLYGEPGADHVEQAMTQGAVIGAANWSEVVQKVRAAHGSMEHVRALVFDYNVVVEPVTQADAEAAAQLWKSGSGLSIADRLCLALSQRVNRPALTADKHWGSSALIRQIR